MRGLHLSRRDFVSATASAAASSFVAPIDALAAAHPFEGVDVRQFGAVGDGLHNDTAAFAAALATSRSVFVPSGLYLVDGVMVPEGRSILTEGFRTIFRQRPALGEEVRMLNIIGSDVTIGDCAVEGNIATDTGEQRHGVFVSASAATGDLSNIRIGNIRGARLRGDVVYVGARDDRSINAVQVGNVHGSNILRNVVSVVGGQRIRIGNITGTNVGYTHLDIEPDDWNGPVIGCFVESVRGSFVQIAGQTPEAFVDQVRIGLLDLAPPQARSCPVYPPGLKQADALTVRNVRSLEIGRLVASGFDGAAIRQVWNPGALADQYLHLKEAELRDCARQPRLASAYVQGDRRATRLDIDWLTIDIGRPGVDAIRDCKSARIGRLSRTAPKDSRVVGESPDATTPVAYALAGASAAFALYCIGRWRR